MLLRVLQSGEYMKVGSSKVEKTDVRVVAATNVDLRWAVSQGKFREDLYYRLGAVQIAMPSLRDRKDDIYLLFRKFTSDFSEKYGKCKVSLSHDAIALLRAYRWPGNIRQLKNITETVSALESRPVTPSVDRVEIDAPTLSRYLPDEQDTLLPAVACTSGAKETISESDKQKIYTALYNLNREVDQLRKLVLEARENGGMASAPALPQAEGAPAEDVEEVEWQDAARSEEEPFSIRRSNDEMIARALEKHGGKVKAAAAELGISERTIYRKLAERKTK